jgi:hypothetical protein
MIRVRGSLITVKRQNDEFTSSRFFWIVRMAMICYNILRHRRCISPCGCVYHITLAFVF